MHKWILIFLWVSIFLILPAVAIGQIVEPSAGGAGGADADSAKGIPFQDTTGNLADNDMMRYNLANNQWEYVVVPGAGGGSADTLIINVSGVEYSIVANRIKLKVGTGIIYTREDSTDYDVIYIINVLGTDIDSSEVVSAEIAEYIRDRVGEMFGGTETGITVTPQDGTDDIDFVVSVVVSDSTAAAADSSGKALFAQQDADGDTLDASTYQTLPEDDEPDDDSEVPNAITVDPINATTEAAIEAVVDLESLQGAVTDGQVPDSMAIKLADDQVVKQKFGDEDWGDVSVSGNSITLDNDVVAAAEMADADHGDVSWSGGTATVEALKGMVLAPAGSTPSDNQVIKIDTDPDPDTLYYANDDAGGLSEQAVKGDHVDSTSENFAFDGAYHKTTAEADSAYMSKKYIDDAAGGLTAQSVKGDHVDSTAENIVFDNAYEGTSAEPDSQYSTHNWVQVEVEDSLNEYSLLASPTFSGTVTAPNLIVTTDVNIADDALQDSSISDGITITEANDADTSGTKLAAALGFRMTNVGDTVTGTYDFTDGDLEDIDSLEANIVVANDSLIAGGDVIKDFTAGDLEIASGVLNVTDDSHNHVITNIDSFSEANLETQLSDVTAVFTNNVTGDVTVSGGTSTIGANKIDSTHAADGDLSLDDLNWPYEKFFLDIVHGWSRALEDSIYLSLPATDGISSWLASDSAGNLTAASADTFMFSGFIPYRCTVESLLVAYKTSNAAAYIDSLNLYGPDRSAYTNMTDSSYYQYTTNMTATVWTIVSMDVTDWTALAGDRYGLKFYNYFDNTDNRCIKVGWVALVVKR